MSNPLFPFKVGQRVKLTDHGVKHGLGPWGRKRCCFGTVVAVLNGVAVKVLRDGTKQARGYHVDFWRKAR